MGLNTGNLRLPRDKEVSAGSAKMDGRGRVWGLVQSGKEHF